MPTYVCVCRTATEVREEERLLGCGHCGKMSSLESEEGTGTDYRAIMYAHTFKIAEHTVVSVARLLGLGRLASFFFASWC